MKSEYPKEMHHPNFAPAVLSDDTKAGPNGGRFREAPPGMPDRFPPVVVNNPDQEEYHASRGYVVGKQNMPLVTQHTRKERENIRMREVPQAEEPGEHYDYPRWVGDKIAKNAEEEAAILAAMTTSEIGEGGIPCAPLHEVRGEIDAGELAEFRAWKANRERSRGSEKNEPVRRNHNRKPFISKDRGSPEQAELLALCAESGIKADTRYSVKRLQEMLDAATAPQEGRVA